MKRVTLLLIFACTPTFADDVIDNASAAIQKQLYIQELKDIIADIDSEILRCEKTQKKWKIATGIGAAGTVATGTAAAIQGIQIYRAKHATLDTENAHPQEDTK